ncbi:MAG: hypothetical protein A2048_10195 [Deltaproteobacteria bacterium GWA2_45_12]|nr:MAG: hypothetical protein A2048_10195 [Deltaproteobacteria bacterium GWA2_45_12]
MPFFLHVGPVQKGTYDQNNKKKSLIHATFLSTILGRESTLNYPPLKKGDQGGFGPDFIPVSVFFSQ